jgi:hypothetical protein
MFEFFVLHVVDDLSLDEHVVGVCGVLPDSIEGEWVYAVPHQKLTCHRPDPVGPSILETKGAKEIRHLHFGIHREGDHERLRCGVLLEELLPHRLGHLG